MNVSYKELGTLQNGRECKGFEDIAVSQRCGLDSGLALGHLRLTKRRTVLEANLWYAFSLVPSVADVAVSAVVVVGQDIASSAK